MRLILLFFIFYVYASYAFVLLLDQQREKSPELLEPPSSVITTHGNTSKFSVYAIVRQAVLAQAIRESTRLYNLANMPTDSDSDSDDDGDDKSKDPQIKLPKVMFKR